jgi:hypothetical protein
VYDPDRKGRLRYAGAADIPATPKDRKVAVTLGNAFDVTASYRTVKTEKLGKRRVRKHIRVKLENARAHAVGVRVVQGFYTPWKLGTSSQPATKPDANTAQWKVAVPAGGSRIVSFAVDFGA